MCNVVNTSCVALKAYRLHIKMIDFVKNMQEKRTISEVAPSSKRTHAEQKLLQVKGRVIMFGPWSVSVFPVININKSHADRLALQCFVVYYQLYIHCPAVVNKQQMRINQLEKIVRAKAPV